MILLLHPTHRKFFRLLREYVKGGNCIILTRKDVAEYELMLKITKNSKKIHQTIYRIFLRAIRRDKKDNTNAEIIINSESVDYIEKVLRKAELKKPLITIRNILVLPLVRFLLRKIKKFDS